MTVTVVNTSHKNEAPMIISYRNWKHFPNDLFLTELNFMLSFHDINNITYDNFDDMVISLVNKHIPLRYKYIRANQCPFMNKALRKAMMIRSKLKNRNLNDKNIESYNNYKTQRNTCTFLLRKAKGNPTANSNV